MCVFCVLVFTSLISFSGSQQATGCGITYCVQGERAIKRRAELSRKRGRRTKEEKCSCNREERLPFLTEGDIPH